MRTKSTARAMAVNEGLRPKVNHIAKALGAICHAANDEVYL